jgi:large subunit ribosomal protein L13
MNKTFMAKEQDLKRDWWVVDAAGLPIGRVASQVASVLRGKNKPIFTANVDTGDHVIIINAAKAILTGKKLDQKLYRHHTGYIGGLKEVKARKMMSEKPDEAMFRAIKGMLPKNSLGRKMIKKLRIYGDDKHNHEAQQPKVLEIKL